MKINEWLNTRVYLDDPTGDLARDAEEDENWPEEGELEDYEDYLEGAGAPENIVQCLSETWDKYQHEQGEEW